MPHNLTRRLLAKLSYANVVATIALFAALGTGGAYAATQLSKNSVGAKQLRKNAVTSRAVKNGSLGAGDLSKKARTKLAGKPGPQGPAGPAGPVAEYYAVVSYGGEIRTSTPGAPSVQPSSLPAGATYGLNFQRDVSNCAYNVTLAAVDAGGGPEAPPPGATATVVSGGGGVVGVSVFDAAGNPARSGFHITVSCPS